MTTATASTLDGGDATRAFQTLTTDTERPQVVRRSNQVNADQRFQGKSPEDIIEMYKNLESHSGRLAGELGQTKQQLTEALATSKRIADLSERPAPSTTQSQTTDVNGMELIANPKQVLDKLIAEQTSKIRKETETRIQSLEQELARSRFERNHSDGTQLWQDPAVAAFANATPLRQELAQRAQRGDYGAADALLTEYKQYKANVAEPEARKGAAAARTVSLEGTGGGESASAGGKIYKRADILALRQKDPEAYYSEGVQNALMRAYKEQRVVD